VQHSVNSRNFTVVGVAQSGQGGSCAVTFTASNGVPAMPRYSIALQRN